MPKQVISLTDSKIKAFLRDIKSNNPNGLQKDIRLSDGAGLNLLIRKNGTVMWRFDYTRPISKKRNTMTVGNYPAMSLAKAREYRDQFRALLTEGKDPQVEKQGVEEKERLKQQATFKSVAELYKSKQRLAEATVKRNDGIFEKLYRDIGNMPISDITPPDLAKVIEKDENKGHIESAMRIRSKASQVFRFAVKMGLCERDVAQDLAGTITQREKNHYSALTDPFDFARLLFDIDHYESQLVHVKLALQLAPLVFVRIGELRNAKWTDINFETATWSYTPSKTSAKTGLDHIVPLSTQAIAILKEAHNFTNNSDFVFPSRSDKHRPISDMSINMALRRMGYGKEDMTGHGFRAIARTLLDEVLEFPLDIIEQQLAHQVRDMHGRAYNRTKHLDKRRVMMQRWSDYCDELKAQFIASRDKKFTEIKPS
ncbi:integrase arm-type DNA-binding domain-containing protein [Acinetobacter radioresistens]|uniref:tyrosine-type recombinase/integrase n=1 Tax=Acinetobacter radioresistens TaxID=40216 RepID=UPI002005FE89|nr:integrase arm-type DNA-binding domain-containing protein [Acinetobacter radioresistens]MCK4086097.1 integrase arm-type DNA-binding domain-containing protein [Acinetobacter radioresistens]